LKAYLVGGAVRDKLLQFPWHESDWVVVGATPDEMIAQGFQPVGKDFPVFLHPESKEEYALARTERKSGMGYHGFKLYYSPDVTLEQDLSRRDFTINAIAQDDDGNLIDPYGGVDDLERKLLQHVSPAFAEDPVRILRGARFLARYAHLGFSLSDDTLNLMRTMVANGEVDALVKQRVWKEFEQMMGERSPLAGIKMLSQCGALPILFGQLASHIDSINPKIAFSFDDSTGNIAMLFSSFNIDDLKQAEAPNKVLKAADTLQRLKASLDQLDRQDIQHNAQQLLAASTCHGLLKDREFAIYISTLLCKLDPVGRATNWLALNTQLANLSPAPFIQQGLKGAEIGAAIKAAQTAIVIEWINEVQHGE